MRPRLKTPEAEEDTVLGYPAVAGKVPTLRRAAISKPEAVGLEGASQHA
jgi:hypothetical protein